MTPQVPNSLRDFSEHLRESELRRIEEVKAALTAQLLAGQPLYKQWIDEYHWLLKNIAQPLLPPLELVPSQLENGDWWLGPVKLAADEVKARANRTT